MTFYYKTYSWANNSNQGISEETKKTWEFFADKKNWRIVQLPNGYFQTEYLIPGKEDSWTDVTRRETMKGAEAAIDASIEHYKKRLSFAQGPVVVKTFK